MNVRILSGSDLGTLESVSGQWQALAQRCAEENVFYEPWVLLPALRYFDNESVRIALVWSSSAEQPGAELMGVFPLVTSAWFGSLPIKHVRMWRHLHCFLSAPLIVSGFEARVLEALLRAIEQQLWSTLFLELDWLPLDGASGRALRLLGECGERVTSESGYFERAILTRAEGGSERFIAGAISPKHRKDLRRKRKNLEMLHGPVRLEQMQNGDSIEEWIEQFLTLEASGWKGQHGSSMKDSPAERKFFAEVVRRGAAGGRVSLSRLWAGDSVVAMKCCLCSIHTVFAFKIAYDERFSRYSPGVLLELENMRWMLDESDFELMDSCAAPGNTLFRRLWPKARPLCVVRASMRSPAAIGVVEAMGVCTRTKSALRALTLRGESGTQVQPGTTLDPATSPVGWRAAGDVVGRAYTRTSIFGLQKHRSVHLNQIAISGSESSFLHNPNKRGSAT